MRFGTYHTYQVPPWTDTDRVYAEELERVHLAEALGFDSVWVPEQHFFDYCASPDALDMVTYLLGETSRVRVGAAVVNLSLTHPLRFVERAALLDRIGGGRVDLCVGRGYQWPQNVVFGVDETTTKRRLDEGLDVVLAAWTGRPFAADGRALRVPRDPDLARAGAPAGRGAADERRRHDAGRGDRGARATARVRVAVRAGGGDRDDVPPLRAAGRGVPARHRPGLDRAMVLLYTLLAPTKDEAHAIARKPYEWHMARLAALSGPAASRGVAHVDG